jgi:hypothetical protein
MLCIFQASHAGVGDLYLLVEPPVKKAASNIAELKKHTVAKAAANTGTTKKAAANTGTTKKAAAKTGTTKKAAPKKAAHITAARMMSNTAEALLIESPDTTTEDVALDANEVRTSLQVFM